MNSKALDNISWYIDESAIQKGEPGIYHSYMRSLATSFNFIAGHLDPVWLMGSSGFAFRIFVNETFCPSAMSIFNFSDLLPKAIEQSGYFAQYICRYWDDKANEKPKQQEAYKAIIAGIDRNTPAIVWDVSDAEWGLIVGYNLEKQWYYTLTFEGEESYLPFDRLGKNGIDILSVAIPGELNKRNRDSIIENSLRAAVAHANQEEWTDRPRYQNGFAAYDLWTLLYERGTKIYESGNEKNIHPNVFNFAQYCVNHNYSARCYARDYLHMIANGNPYLSGASQCYQKVVNSLHTVWTGLKDINQVNTELLRSGAQHIKDAKAAEIEGIELIKQYLASV